MVSPGASVFRAGYGLSSSFYRPCLHRQRMSLSLSLSLGEKLLLAGASAPVGEERWSSPRPDNSPVQPRVKTKDRVVAARGCPRKKTVVRGLFGSERLLRSRDDARSPDFAAVSSAEEEIRQSCRARAREKSAIFASSR